MPPGPEHQDAGPRRRGRRLSRRSAGAALTAALSLIVIVAVTPAAGAASSLASGLARTVRQMVSSGPAARAFAGTPAVGALFTLSAGRLGQHFCTASVVSSPHGDLVLTAAHCASGNASDVVFVPGYDNGRAPYGLWSVQRVYEDKAWQSSADPDDDAAFLQVTQPGSVRPIQDVTGAERLITGPAGQQLVKVIGYPDAGDGPVACQNRIKEPMARQLEFDCGGFTDGTSGGPFLADVNPATGRGTVIGIIGGYEQGGNSPELSYSSAFGKNIATLYAEAVAGS